MILYLVGAITSLNPGFNINQGIADKLPVGTSVDVYINSPGGRIDQAFEFGRALSRLNATCFVEYAASAAFEVVMPACKKIVMAPKSQLIFHSAMWCIHGMKDTADILMELREGLKISNAMASLMNNYWGTSQCSVEIRQKFADVNAPCSVLHMLNETVLTGKEFKSTFPKAAPFITISPQDRFPLIPNMNQSKIEKSETSPTTCEIL